MDEVGAGWVSREKPWRVAGKGPRDLGAEGRDVAGVGPRVLSSRVKGRRDGVSSSTFTPSDLFLSFELKKFFGVSPT